MEKSPIDGVAELSPPLVEVPSSYSDSESQLAMVLATKAASTSPPDELERAWNNPARISTVPPFAEQPISVKTKGDRIWDDRVTRIDQPGYGVELALRAAVPSRLSP